MLNKSIVLNTDSYKVSMWKQYPPKTEIVFSYIESRGGRYDKTLFFGLQAFLKEYLSTPVTKEDVELADKLWTAHGEPFNKEGWMRLVEKHNGKLPLRIRAVKEGSIIPNSNVLVTVENTDPEFFWLTTWIETALLRAVWYPTTVASNSWTSKQVIKQYLEETGDASGLPFKLHDFGARGVSSFESAALGGAAHLVNFMGSDTFTANLALMEYYGADMASFSIPAAEHSTITSWGQENEVDAYRNMLTQFAKPGSLVAVVSDSYDIFNACKLWGTKLKQQILNSGATLIIRPDSGVPEIVVLEVTRILDQYFGHIVNDKGYKVLNSVRVIQGDGINTDSIRRILENLKTAGYSADNIAFGQGGALLQQLDRDTNRWAMKCSWAQIDGKGVDVFKDPVTDTGKRSKKGRITLVSDPGGWDITTIQESDVKHFNNELLETVWENGELKRNQTLDEIRLIANSY